jgi:hypothetical protein
MSEKKRRDVLFVTFSIKIVTTHISVIQTTLRCAGRKTYNKNKQMYISKSHVDLDNPTADRM